MMSNGTQDSEAAHYAKQLTKPQIQKRRATITPVGEKIQVKIQSFKQNRFSLHLPHYSQATFAYFFSSNAYQTLPASEFFYLFPLLNPCYLAPLYHSYLSPNITSLERPCLTILKSSLQFPSQSLPHYLVLFLLLYLSLSKIFMCLSSVSIYQDIRFMRSGNCLYLSWLNLQCLVSYLDHNSQIYVIELIDLLQLFQHKLNLQ